MLKVESSAVSSDAAGRRILCMSAYLVLALRLLVPLSIFRWPFVGALLSIAADAMDSVIFRNFGWGVLSPSDYQAIDKYFDLYYLTFEALVVFQWRDLLWRRIGLGLFFVRFIGVLLFEITGVRALLFFLPNIFENFYLLSYVLRRAMNQKVSLSLQYGFGVLLIAALPKLAQEYAMHYLEMPLGLGTIWAYFQHGVL